MSLKIGICDDNAIDLDILKDSIKGILSTLKINRRITIFEGPGAVLNSLNDVACYDIFVIDVNMPRVNGVALARKIKKINPDIFIIFVSNSNDIVYESFAVEPFRYIRKKYLQEELPEAICAIASKRALDTVLRVEKGGSNTVAMRISEIDFLESQGHYVNIHCNHREKCVRGRIGDYEEQLKEYGFMRIHIAYLVNMKNIYNITAGDVTMNDGTILPISKARADEIRKCYSLYVRNNIRGVFME